SSLLGKLAGGHLQRIASSDGTCSHAGEGAAHNSTHTASLLSTILDNASKGPGTICLLVTTVGADHHGVILLNGLAGVPRLPSSDGLKSGICHVISPLPHTSCRCQDHADRPQ